ncbi:hypothetical protein SDRG_03102 [Saprolegnia diclina VS20]|uniref:Uncharacterized protein n=1 Tax=Saprolegnia diclina (strain VS20) TaxID=1156394 RepID=T0S3P6_SAPDV|nr:hypothetical protein SDRG_03102 [Saprolegnia diclina VS20]EQC39673.1 hypothetical protein SDRG_03102 [Saprolegnia diclina VS20]|eukprot:XP_008606945.1 hypothetical protein SDRG_03102 [Saprolegnia diclina VS20]
MEVWEPSARALTSAAKDVAVLLRGKNYLRDQKAFMAHLHADALRHTAWTSCVVVVFDGIFRRSPDEEKATDNALITYAIIPWCESFGRAVSYVTATRMLEAYCVEALPLRLAGKLMKNLYTSSLRKMIRYQNKTLVAKLMLKTTARASLLTHLAIFLVEQVYLLARNPTLAEVTKASVKNAHRCVLAVAGASLGAAVGSLIEPGRGTLIGAMICEDLFTSDHLSNHIFFHGERHLDFAAKKL